MPEGLHAGLDRDDRQDIADLLVRYASAIDRRDWQLLRSCFTDNCTVDYQDVAVWHTADELTEYMRDVHAPCSGVLHRITNQSISQNVDGSVAARSYVDALVLFSADTGFHMAGFYDDRIMRTDDGWKIAERRYSRVLQEPVGSAPSP